MKVVVIFIIVAPVLSYQHNHCDTCSDELDESVVYDTGHSPLYYRGDDTKKHKKHNSGTKQHSASLETSINPRESRSRRKSKKYDCVCECRQKCENLQKCCRPVCSKECDQTEENSVESEPGVGGGNGNLVFVPYPYPLVVPPPMPPMPPMPPFPMPVPPNANTTTSARGPRNYAINRRQSETDDAILDLLQSLRRRQEPPQVNMRPVRARQIPEYEEIDDQLLDQLIRLRNVKDINS